MGVLGLVCMLVVNLHLLHVKATAIELSSARKPGKGTDDGCTNIEGNCQNFDTDCDGTVHYSKKYCKSKKQFCCVPSNGCPEDDGYFYYAPSDQCFKFLQDERVNFFDAQKKCSNQSEEGLTLAHPYMAVELRENMIERFGGGAADVSHKECWLNAKRDGTTYFQWGDNGDIIANKSPLWWREVSGSGLACLNLLVQVNRLVSHPNEPYYADSCSALLFPLCEKRK